MFGTTGRLLAKSGKPTVYLDGHTSDVEIALQQLRQMWPELPEVLLLAARFHDFGKAASGFQNMLLPGGTAWRFRHEVLSAAIFRGCFDISVPELFIAYLSILCHHKNLLDKDGRVSESLRHCQSIGRAPVWFSKWRELDVERLRQTFRNDLANWTYDSATRSPADEVIEISDALRPVFEDLSPALCRGAIVAADHIASSRIGQINAGASITHESLEQYARSKIAKWRSWRGIQKKAGKLCTNASLIAPTGAGKTEAALLWALSNRVGVRANSRIFYVLPYQVSINAMAERLNQVFPSSDDLSRLYSNSNISIVHANSDLAYLQDAMNDGVPSDRSAQIARANKNAASKIYAPIKVATAYQLLEIFFGRKFFEVGLLELTKSIIIFDEIHAYDGHTLGLIITMLECLGKLDARIFIMTATLPESLRRPLFDAARIDQASGVLRLRSNDRLLSEVRRTIIMRPESIDALTADIRSAFGEGRKTLVACNTVKKAILMRELLGDLDPILIHSRFTLGDRARRESKENIERPEHRLVIATQVVEVSLDVSFDILFTELAPADDLVQRFGRINRHGASKSPAGCHVACGDIKGSAPPYEEDILAATMEHFPTTPLTFAVTQKWIEAVYPNGLPKAEQAHMDNAERDFRNVVANLRPMVDPPDNDLEKNLFESAQVVPAVFAKKWASHTRRGEHLEARQLLVSVNLKVWNNVCRDRREEAVDKIYYRRGNRDRYQLVALFPYSSDNAGRSDGSGLRLDKPPVPSPIMNCNIISDSEDV